MATKPTIADARWATDGAAELTAPSSGQRDSGFEGGTAAVADYANVLHKEAYKWAQYLDDGDLAGDHSITGALDVTGNATVGGDLDLGGAFYRPAMTRKIPVAGNYSVGGGSVTPDADTGAPVMTSADAVVLVPLPVDEGEQITLVQARVSGDVGTNQPVKLKVFRVDTPSAGVTTRTQLGATGTVATGDYHETITSGVIAEHVSMADDYHYIAEFTLPGWFDTPGVVYAIYLTTTRPVPP